MSEITLDRFDSTTVLPLLDRLVDVYVNDVYADDPVIGDDARFREQINQHMRAPRWQLVTATSEHDIIGYIYGLALAPDTDWWDPLITPVPEGFTTEDGKRTIAISELLVRQPWRRRGIATALHDELLAGRLEERATLFAQPSNTAGHAAYARWGWTKAAQVHPKFEGAPIYDVMILHLTPSTG